MFKCDLSDIEKIYRNDPQFGVVFGIDTDDYKKPKGVRVMFGESQEGGDYGTIQSIQKIIINHHCVGYLDEYISHNYFHPMCHRFKVYIDDEKVTDAIRNSPHYDKYQGCMQFATLQQMIEFLDIKPYVWKRKK